MWRTTPLVPNQTLPHYPQTCGSCNSSLEINPEAKPYMGYYVLELEKLDSGIDVKCTLHHYYHKNMGLLGQCWQRLLLVLRSFSLSPIKKGLTGSRNGRMFYTFTSLSKNYRNITPRVNFS
jgi:hypothetical protein